MRLPIFTTLSLLFSLLLLIASAEQCGSQAGGSICASGLCCSKFGWCGNTDTYCGPGNCQSQCPSVPSPKLPTTDPGPLGDQLGSIISNSMFDQMLKHRNDNVCEGKNNFYSYNAFITAARSYPGFGTTGDITTRKREIAAFFAQTSHETTGGWPMAPDGPYAWGYCFLREQGSPGDYCTPSSEWPCVPGKKYFGRGPIQLTSNLNYGPFGRAINEDLLNNPYLVATDPVISFKSAIWFWMTPQYPKPSCHNVIIGSWQPSSTDQAANRIPGFGVITNIINGGVECGHGNDDKVQDRIGFYMRYCGMLGVSPGDNLDCGNQMHF